MTKKIPLILTIILVVAFLLRLYNIASPVADWHSWRQADTAAVTRNFYTFGFNPLYPRYDDLSNVQTGYDNPEGYRFVEFPIYQIAVYSVSSVFSFLPVSLEVWHRLVSIIVSLGSIYLIYLIGKQYINSRVGIMASFLFAVFPYSIYYSRVILPEVFLVFFILLTIHLFSKAVVYKKQTADINIQYLLFSAVIGASALLIKPIAVFFFVPIVYLWIYHRFFSNKQIGLAVAYAVVVISPLIIWRMWMSQFPEGIPVWQWLFNGKVLDLNGGIRNIVGDTQKMIVFLFGYQEGGIRYRPAFFYWIGWKRITELILGYFGVLLLISGVVGLIMRCIKHWAFFVSLLAGAILYVIIFAEGNVRHDYYQVVTLPVIYFVSAIGIDYLLSVSKKFNKERIGIITIAVIIISSVWISWQQVKTYYWINNQAIVDAGISADNILPQNAKVIAPYGGDTAFLYQVNRQGWPVGFEIEEKVKKGATHYVSVTPEDPEVLYVKELYTVIEETDDYVIVSLQ